MFSAAVFQTTMCLKVLNFVADVREVLKGVNVIAYKLT